MYLLSMCICCLCDFVVCVYLLSMCICCLCVFAVYGFVYMSICFCCLFVVYVYVLSMWALVCLCVVYVSPCLSMYTNADWWEGNGKIMKTINIHIYRATARFILTNVHIGRLNNIFKHLKIYIRRLIITTLIHFLYKFILQNQYKQINKILIYDYL